VELVENLLWVPLVLAVFLLVTLLAKRALHIDEKIAVLRLGLRHLLLGGVLPLDASHFFRVALLFLKLLLHELLF
jgi:hypothetical protein